MNLEKILDHPYLQLIVIDSRYGGGFVAAIEIEDHAVLQTVNDLNGETEWEFYGLWQDDSWYPVMWGETVQKAVSNLEEKIKPWSDEQGKIVGDVLNILRQTKKTPDYGLKIKPRTLEELKVWYESWYTGPAEIDSIFG